jgi:hypothetical protein
MSGVVVLIVCRLISDFIENPGNNNSNYVYCWFFTYFK